MEETRVWIIDTTLRDGEQQAGVALTPDQKWLVGQLLDGFAEISEIEAGIPAMGGDEARAVSMIASGGLRSRVTAWNRIREEDIRASMACRPDWIHMTVPVSRLHLSKKLKMTADEARQQMMRCVAIAADKGFGVSVGFEDASRAEEEELLRFAAAASRAGAARVRLADTVGVWMPSACRRVMETLSGAFPDLTFAVHAHNDFGMAVANSLAAILGGACCVDVTAGGMGERAGNCRMSSFIRAGWHKGWFSELAGWSAEKTEHGIMRIIHAQSRGHVLA